MRHPGLIRLCIILICFFQNKIIAQIPVSIPAFTGYAIPLERCDGNDESILFSRKEGLHNWQNKSQQIHYYFYLRNSGILNIALMIKNKSAGNEIRLRIQGKLFKVAVPKSLFFKKTNVGSINIAKPGFYDIEIFGAKKIGKSIADIQSIELSGGSTKDMQFNKKPRRNAASVHLMYPLPDTAKAVAFYNEVTVPQNADQLYSYFMACGFSRGYFGMQVNGAMERRIIFSVWDAGNEAADRNKVAEGNKVKLLAKGIDVAAEGFDNEGTGGHSHFVYNWKSGETYKFYVTALPDSESNTTIYTGYFFIPELQKWKLIASFKAPKDAKYLSHLYSFVENFQGSNGNLFRKADYSNQWIRTESGEWREITNATFSCDATGKAVDRIDVGGGVENNSFYLWNGGFQNTNTAFGSEFTREGSNTKPLIDLYKNVDSAAQIAKDKKQIDDSIAAGKLDTTGTYNNVYYKMLKEGDGEYVDVNDTLTVNYKGWVIDGNVFDETKSEPATFPLNRLIKGWQIGLTKCRKGGKIRLIIPSTLAYSIRARAEKIPPNSILLFDIEVLDIKK